MRILLTGASSFTGSWFARKLASEGHELVMPLRRTSDAYEGVRARRVRALNRWGTTISGVTFGEPSFMEMLEKKGPWDVLCHHAADVANYKSEAFDVVRALASNTRNARTVLATFKKRGGTRVVITGTVFEPGEGAGSEGLPAGSPYGLSKGFTSQLFEYYAKAEGLHLGKFVIANPFGPFDKLRFTKYLVKSWARGEVPTVKTPAYVRDNIHVSLLAAAYADFVASRPSSTGFTRFNPSGYVESQGDFALRFAEEIGARLELSCDLALSDQTEFPEPRIRINTDPIDGDRYGWDESAAWDELASYYRRWLEGETIDAEMEMDTNG